MPVSARYWPIPIADPIIGATLVDIDQYIIYINGVLITNRASCATFPSLGQLIAHGV